MGLLFSWEKPRRKKRVEKKDPDTIMIGIPELLSKYFFKEDIVSLCEDADLNHKGVKDELIERLVKDGNYTKKDYLESLGMETLKDICADVNEYRTGRKDELIKRILPHIEEESIDDEILEEPDDPPIIRNGSNRFGQDSLGRVGETLKVGSPFDTLCSIIEQWTPDRRYENESGYKAELYSFFKYNFDYRIRQEAGKSRADILIGDNIAVEIKKNPNSESYDRLLTQLVRQKKEFGYAIGLIFEARNRDAFEDFMELVEDIKDIRIIKK